MALLVSCAICNLLILIVLLHLRYWQPWCIANGLEEAAMIRRTYSLHYRLVNGVIAGVVSIGTAVLLSYLILWSRF